MKRKTWINRLASIVLVAATLGGVAVAVGTQGSQSNPLITLDYLNQKAIPEILEQVEKKIDDRVKKLTEDVKEGPKATFTVVEVGAGQTVTLSAGTQLLLRSGAMASYDGLIDLTDGVGLAGIMTVNHLYIAPGEGQTVTASSSTVLMVQGNYTLN